MSLRKTTAQKKEDKDIIRWRGHEVLRIEAFSDAVLAFAVTLLVVSLEVPHNFDELMHMMRGFFPFAICFLLFFQIWMSQNLFFRRFGLHDERTIIYNGLLLFVMLYFAFPLKFLWTVLFHNIKAITGEQFVTLLYCYGAGCMAVYLLFAAMYHHAYRKRESLGLTEREAFETRTYMYRNLGIAGVAVLSMALAACGPQFVAFSGMSYSLIGAVVSVTHSRRGKIHRKKYGRSIHDEVIDVKEGHDVMEN